MTFVCLLFLSIQLAAAQTVNFIGEEPDPSELGAPLYPGSSFVRVMATIDPFFKTVFYVSPEPVGDVKNYFGDQLPAARMVQYRDEYEWVWVYLLNPRTPFPDKPTRDDLPLLDTSPNVMVKKFQDDLHEPLIELFQSRPEAKKQLDALLEAKTLIRYTYRTVEEDIGFIKLAGIWKNVDRAYPEYRGMKIEFKSDSTYVLTLTDGNMEAWTKKLSGTRRFADVPPDSVTSYLAARNPESGRFSIIRNSIDMSTDTPVIGDALKSGLADVQKFMFTVQFINMPKLTFIRERE